jgi:PAS domain S-box-containing protein
MRSEPKRSVEADEFVLRDDDGLMRAALKMTADGPCLFFYDHREKIRAGLVGGKNAPRLFLLDRDGKPRASLGLAAGDNADRRFRALIEATPQLVWTTNAAGEVIEDVPSWSSFTGQNEEASMGSGWMQALHPDDRERVATLSKQALEMREPYEAEYRVRRQDGEYRDFAVRAVPVMQIDEAIGEWVVAATDISEHKRLEESLQVSEEHLAAATSAKTQLEEALRASEEQRNALNVTSTQLQESLRRSEENLAASTSAKAQLEEALRAGEEQRNGLTVAYTQLQESFRASELSHAGEQKRLEEALRASEERLNALSSAKTQLEETLQRSREDYAARRSQLEEAIHQTQEQLNDQIVAKGQLEDTLRGREDHYRALIAATSQLVWTTSCAGEVGDATPSWMSFTGQSTNEAQGRGWLQALHPDDRENADKVLNKALETRTPYKGEFRLRRHDGEYRVLAVRGAPVVDRDGSVHEWIGTALDVTEDKQLQMSRRASEKKYREIVESAPEGIWIIDSDNRTTFTNPRLAQMLGWNNEEMPGKSLFDFLDEENRQSALENLACCRQGVAVQFDLNLRTLDGRNLRTRASTLPLFDEVGQYSGALALIIDLTEPKLLEGQQQQEQKLRALGQLAGGVAHGLNNFLTVINGYTELLLGKVPRSSPMHESVAQIKKAGEQAASLISPLLAFSQGQMLWSRMLNLNEVVTEAEKNLRPHLREDIRISTVLSPSLGPVDADPEQLQQVLMNLASNALDAMPGRGNLVIGTENEELNESYAAKHPGVAPGPYVHLTVSDSGTGMSAETLAHLFEPFFSTKNQGQISGLGLATAYGIIKQSGGSITVESELGKGSTFHIYLPRVGETVPLPEEGKPGITTLRGTETILVVEDQEEIRRLAQVVLKSYGYKVVVAANGWEALLYSERHVGPIHLMLTDVVMPGMTGQELADRLRPLRPEMQVLFISGYIENGMVQPHTLDAGTGFLAKPFSPEALATKIREALGPPRSVGKVLVVDSEEEIRSFLQMVLSSVGFAVLEAESGEQALRNLEGEVVDMILVDLGKPGQHELDLVRLLQKRRPDLKVIAMSGTLGEEFLRAAEELGANATLGKPIRADQLLETVRRTTAG